MSSKAMLKRSAKAACGVLAVGSLLAPMGCDAVDGLLSTVRTTAVSTVQETAQAAIQDAVGGILGGVIPGAGGA